MTPWKKTNPVIFGQPEMVTQLECVIVRPLFVVLVHKNLIPVRTTLIFSGIAISSRSKYTLIGLEAVEMHHSQYPNNATVEKRTCGIGNSIRTCVWRTKCQPTQSLIC